MVTFPAAVLAMQGGMLSCSARGTPSIYTALIRNSTVLVNTTNTATVRLDEDGNYTCQATNQYGSDDKKEFQVNFTSKSFFNCSRPNLSLAKYITMLESHSQVNSEKNALLWPCRYKVTVKTDGFSRRLTWR